MMIASHFSAIVVVVFSSQSINILLLMYPLWTTPSSPFFLAMSRYALPVSLLLLVLISRASGMTDKATGITFQKQLKNGLELFGVGVRKVRRMGAILYQKSKTSLGC